MRYNITPVAKPRMTTQDRYPNRPPKYKGKEWPRPAVTKYRKFCDAVKAHRVNLPKSGAHVTFIIPMPPSWSRNKRLSMSGEPHEQTPDLDNFLKALCDAVYSQDKDVSDVRVTKIWGSTGEIVITEEKQT